MVRDSGTSAPSERQQKAWREGLGKEAEALEGQVGEVMARYPAIHDSQTTHAWKCKVYEQALLILILMLSMYGTFTRNAIFPPAWLAACMPVVAALLCLATLAYTEMCIALKGKLQRGLQGAQSQAARELIAECHKLQGDISAYRLYLLPGEDSPERAIAIIKNFRHSFHDKVTTHTCWPPGE
jgi:hypothetical protein